MPPRPTTRMTARNMPKRKRSDTIHSSLTPLDMSAVIERCEDMDDDSVEGGGGNSPRSKVAERFRSLNIEAPAPSPVPTEALPEPERAIHAPKKRTKRGTPQEAARQTSGPAAQQHDGPATPPPSRDRKIQVEEINETPGAYARYPSSPPLSPSPRKKVALKARFTDSTSPTAAVSASAEQPRLSPLLPTPITTSLDALLTLPTRTISPLDLSPPPKSAPSPDNPHDVSVESTPDPSALFWQDTEITGHEVDMSRDDDGTGINGLGFRLTPAMAYARSQKRKQQVSEWRAREAREARQRRFNRRRGEGTGAGGQVVEAPRRAVRFAEV